MGVTLQKNDVLDYVKAHKNAWSPATQKSEAGRLPKYLADLNGDPNHLWSRLEANGLGAYSRVTLWVRVTHFWDWLIERGTIENKENPYRVFRRSRANARLFKNAYSRKTTSVSYHEAKNRISKIENESIKNKALDLLHSGMRYTESNTVQLGVCTGKGGKKREVFFFEKSQGPEYKGSYRTFLRHLESVDFKPHDLRKIFLSTIVNNSETNPFQLQEMAGWRDLKTAQSYINVNSGKLKELVKDSFNAERRTRKRS